MSDNDDFDWHALNYRTAHTAHAQAMWAELEACLQRKIAAAVAEAIAAKDAEIAALRADRDSWEQQASDRVDDCLQFIEEAKALRADAERYRWLRSIASTGKWQLLSHYADASLDFAIDAAREAG